MPKKKTMYKRPDGLYEKMLIINGKRKAFRGKSEAEVFRKIAAYRGEVEKGRAFKVVAEEWHDKLWPTLAHNTTSGYNAAYRRVVDAFGNLSIKELRPAQIEAFVQELCLKGYAKKTVAMHLQLAKQICTHAVLSGDIEYSPAMYVMLPGRLPEKHRELPSDDQIDRIIKGLEAEFGLFAYLILYTGLRRGEALALTHGDIDRERGLVHVTKSLYWESNDPHIKLPKSKAGERDVILPDILADAIKPGAKNVLLFPGLNGELITSSQFRAKYKKYQRECGVTVTPHEIRHAYATMLYDAGVDAKAAQEQLGHSSVAITQDIYTHISQRRRKDTRERINAQFGTRTQKIHSNSKNADE